MSRYSRHHRNTAHASPALDGPTLYWASEESGTTTKLNLLEKSPALLRAASCVNTPETNSLCCAAAGIIVPLRASAEALIPHEKLREAATPDATLIAQNRPPAQLVVGYKQVQTAIMDEVTA